MVLNIRKLNKNLENNLCSTFMAILNSQKAGASEHKIQTTKKGFLISHFPFMYKISTLITLRRKTRLLAPSAHHRGRDVSTSGCV